MHSNKSLLFMVCLLVWLVILSRKQNEHFDYNVKVAPNMNIVLDNKDFVNILNGLMPPGISNKFTTRDYENIISMVTNYVRGDPIITPPPK